MLNFPSGQLLQRILEPEIMDDWSESVAYDQMDFAAIDRDFARSAISLIQFNSQAHRILDIGTGTAKIPIILCQERSNYQVLAVDLAESMLTIGQQNIAAAGLTARIELVLADGKSLPYQQQSFDSVISNSLAHHIPEPIDLFREIARLVHRQGAVLIRDLIRPSSLAEIDQIISAAGSFDQRQTQLFRDSLQAALTLSEVQELVDLAELSRAKVYQSSDRHWTVAVTAESRSDIAEGV
jgi:ubiquinone/menaquinone biosynthesis C-methylase UbiE